MDLRTALVRWPRVDGPRPVRGFRRHGVVFLARLSSARLGSKKAGRQSAQVDVMHKSYLVLGFWSRVPLEVLEARPMGRAKARQISLPRWVLAPRAIPSLLAAASPHDDAAATPPILRAQRPVVRAFLAQRQRATAVVPRLVPRGGALYRVTALEVLRTSGWPRGGARALRTTLRHGGLRRASLAAAGVSKESRPTVIFPARPLRTRAFDLPGSTRAIREHDALKRAHCIHCSAIVTKWQQ